MDDWLPEVRRQLDAIAALPAGWDSYGSASLDLRVVEAAWHLLLCLYDAGGVRKPHVNPMPSGGVQLEWESADRYFELEVLPEGGVECFWRDDKDGVEA